MSRKKTLFYTKKHNKFTRGVFLLVLIIIFVLPFTLTTFKGFKSSIKTNINTITMKKIEKKDLGDLPNWNLKDLYTSINSPRIQKDLDFLNTHVKDFEERLKNKLKFLNGEAFYNVLVEYEFLEEKMARLGSYAFLKYAEDSSKKENVSFYQATLENLTKFSSHLLFLPLEINKLSNVELNQKYLKFPKLQKYKSYLSDLREFKKHQLDEVSEKIFLDKSLTGRQAWVRLFSETINNMEFEFNGQNLNSSQILTLIKDKDEKVRKKAGKVFNKKLSENIKLLAYITNTLAKDKETYDKWHKFSTPISSRNLNNFVEDKVVASLINTVKKNYPNISHRYYKLKAKMMGKKKLHYTDRNAPLPFEDEKIYKWQEAKQIVLSSYRNFSPKMSQIAEQFFANNWIDAPIKKGKRSGAFSASTTSSIHPYILMNYQGNTRDIMTLAHELGHGIHQTLSAKQSYLMMDAPLILAETASVFGEQLTFRQLLKQETNLEKKKVILANKIEDMINTVVRQIAFLEFEIRVHNERKSGEIPVEKLNSIWIQVQKESLGSSFILDDEYKYSWSYIPHFINSPFYVYSYAFGDCVVNSLYSVYLENPERFEKKYIKMLEAGGSLRYKEILAPFGLDPSKPEFWQKGLDVIIGLIDELEKL